jgi:hypothetical protein
MERYPGTTPRQTGSDTQGGQVTEQAKQQSQQVAQQTQQKAGQLADQARQQVKSRLATQKDQAAEQLSPIKTAFQETGQQLRNQGQSSVAQYADKAADQIERFSGYLRESDVEEIMDEVRNFARSRPALFLGGAAALGFFGTRFLKSSSEEGTSGGYGSSATPTATSEATVTHGTQEPPGTALPPSYAGERSGQPPNVAEGELDRETDLRRHPRDFEVE